MPTLLAESALERQQNTTRHILWVLELWARNRGSVSIPDGVIATCADPRVVERRMRDLARDGKVDFHPGGRCRYARISWPPVQTQEQRDKSLAPVPVNRGPGRPRTAGGLEDDE